MRALPDHPSAIRGRTRSHHARANLRGARSWHSRCTLGIRTLSCPPTHVAVRGTSGRVHRMNPRHYIDLKETSRDLQPTYYFMINCLLYSRMETGLVSNQDFYDEDVNVYLAHLLHSFINPEYVEQSQASSSRSTTPTCSAASSNSSDARLKYLIYKTNADFLLVSIGIFDNPMAAGGVARQAPAERRGLHRPRQDLLPLRLLVRAADAPQERRACRRCSRSSRSASRSTSASCRTCAASTST